MATKIQLRVQEAAKAGTALLAVIALGKPSLDRTRMLNSLVREHGFCHTFAACICRHKRTAMCKTMLPRWLLVSHTNIPELAGAEEVGEAADYLASLGYTILCCSQGGKLISADDAVAVFRQNGNPYYEP
jgi:hypothetical protein